MPLLTRVKDLLYQFLLPGRFIHEKYQAFKNLLAYDRTSHELIAELESIYYDQKKVDFCAVVQKYGKLSQSTFDIINCLQAMAPLSYRNLGRIFKEIDAIIQRQLTPLRTESSTPFVLAIDEIAPERESLVGGKAGKLAALLRELDLPVPKGFAITTNAFNAVCESNRLRMAIDTRLADLDIESASSLESSSRELTEIFRNALIPPSVAKAMTRITSWMRNNPDPARRVCVRSSATGEDASGLSFAGQYQSVLNVDEKSLANAYKEVIASKYSPRALYYRVNHGLLDSETPMAVLVLEMIEAMASGVLYTRNPVHPDSDTMMIYAIGGLGERLVGGSVAPDVFEISRGDNPQVVRSVSALNGFSPTTSGQDPTHPLSPDAEPSGALHLGQERARQLAVWAQRLEAFFQGPQDIEWCLDREGNLFILQCRPLFIEASTGEPASCPLLEIPNELLLAAGEKAASGIGVGKVFKVLQPSDLNRVPIDSVLVAPTTSPHFVQVIDRLRAVVTDIGSTAGHFASIAREFGIPTLVNTKVATEVLRENEMVTVYADGCKVFAGIVETFVTEPCARKFQPIDHPARRKLTAILEKISPLNLVDPQSPIFTPEHCETVHDIIRFAHEKAVQEMFFLAGKRGMKLKGAKRLLSHIPILLYVLDLGQGIREGVGDVTEVHPEDIRNVPFRAIWKGLSHPDIFWSSEIMHFDWEAFDTMSGGIVSMESPLLASYALFSQDYLNLSVHFGYHFVVVDCLCSPTSSLNYLSIHFKGGGAAPENKRLRVEFVARILKQHGFEVRLTGDVLDARLDPLPSASLEEKLDMVGRLLGCTRLLDMIIADEATVDTLTAEFLKGNYRFGPIGTDQVRIQRRYFHRQV
jgi:pyruvate, water dikinase